MFATVPIEIFLIIRCYLVVFDVPEDVDEIHAIIRKEAERSWRSFLIVNRACSSIRRDTMIWSLNKMTIKKYFEYEQFRRYLNDRMVNPAKQLQFQSQHQSTCSISNELMLEFIRTSSIGFISISDNDLLDELPSSSGLQVLKMFCCVNVKKIGDYPNLKTLDITGCPCLESIGKMNRLQNLAVRHQVAPVINPDQFLAQFPLEQIQKLKIYNITETFFKLSHRLTGLKSLLISQCLTSQLSFPGELFPSLIELQANCFKQVRLAGMICLRKLQTVYTPSSRIFGKQDIFPQLKSFIYFVYAEPVPEETFLLLLKNVNSLTLQGTLQSDFLESLSEWVTSLSVHLKGQEITIPDRCFEMVKLQSCNLDVASSFSKVQILVLNSCPSITDIIPFKDIPYLELIRLSEVKDFSSLGNQRYLKIEDCQELSNEAVSGLGNVFHLYISHCHLITEVRNLNGKIEFLTLRFCLGLKSVELSEKDYIYVRIFDRINLDNFSILGSVYSLNFSFSERWTKETIPRKYQYLNGEEIEK
jgi:hypothetical protein